MCAIYFVFAKHHCCQCLTDYYTISFFFFLLFKGSHLNDIFLPFHYVYYDKKKFLFLILCYCALLSVCGWMIKVTYLYRVNAYARVCQSFLAILRYKLKQLFFTILWCVYSMCVHCWSNQTIFVHVTTYVKTTFCDFFAAILFETHFFFTFLLFL